MGNVQLDLSISTNIPKRFSMNASLIVAIVSISALTGCATPASAIYSLSGLYADQKEQEATLAAQPTPTPYQVEQAPVIRDVAAEPAKQFPKQSHDIENAIHAVCDAYPQAVSASNRITEMETTGEVNGVGDTKENLWTQLLMHYIDYMKPLKQLADAKADSAEVDECMIDSESQEYKDLVKHQKKLKVSKSTFLNLRKLDKK